MKPQPLKYPLCVVIPVYNAPRSIDALAESIRLAVGDGIEQVCFLFSDDASPDPQIAACFQNPFFKRPDVSVHRNSRNLGFIGNVNQAVAMAEKHCDILLLNSDTQVFPEIFSLLQEDAYSDPKIASVTPLTNNGTIASLFRFPVGDSEPQCLKPFQIARAARQLNLSVAKGGIPSGVGFCQYLKRSVIDEIGMFDAAFGRGYGEENDWSQRAIARGYRHVISSRVYVHHEGTQSFLSSEKKAAARHNTKLLVKRYPSYLKQTTDYAAADPMKLRRLAVILGAFRLETGRRLVLMVLHSDPLAKTAAGTERHVSLLSQELEEHAAAAVHCFSVGDESFTIRLKFRDEIVCEETFHEAVLSGVLIVLGRFAEVLHVHHILGLSDGALNALKRASFACRWITLHDFYALCPSINLLTGLKRDRFCEVELNEATCQNCLTQFYGLKDSDIGSFRRSQLNFIRSFDLVLTPSRAMKIYFERGWSQLGEIPKISVIPHDLTQLRQVSPAKSTAFTRTVVFLGVFSKHKGSEIILSSLNALKAKGYTPIVLGHLFPENDPRRCQLEVNSFHSYSELVSLLEKWQPFAIVHPSLTAESFCYAFYEGSWLAPQALSIVGPYGHPANVIEEHGGGIVMKRLNADGLLEALDEAERRRETLLTQKMKWIDLKTNRSYATTVFPQDPIGITDLSDINLDELALAEFQAVRQQRLRQVGKSQFLRAREKVGGMLNRYPLLKQRLWRWELRFKQLFR